MEILLLTRYVMLWTNLQPGGIYYGRLQMAGASSWPDFRENINIVILIVNQCFV